MSKWICFLASNFLSFLVQASMLCSGALSASLHDSPYDQWNKELNKSFRMNMVGDANLKQSELYFYWHMAYPFKLTKVDDFHYSVGFSSKRMRIYRNHDDLSADSPLLAINTLFARQSTSNHEMLEGFLKSYKDRVSESIIKAIVALEDLIESTAKPRQSFGYVGTGPLSSGGEIVGTFRVYNGVPAHSDTPAELPLEHSLMNDGVRTRTAQKLKQMRDHNPHALIFEIGKLSLFGDEVKTLRARNMLELFLLKNYVESLPEEALFYVHAVTPAHVRLYERRYGFRVIEKVLIPNQKEQEFILEATGRELRNSLLKIHQLKPSGLTLTYSQQ